MESKTRSRNGFDERTELSRRVRGRPPGVSLMTYWRSSSPSSARAPGAGEGAAAMTGATPRRGPAAGFWAQLLKHDSLPLLTCLGQPGVVSVALSFFSHQMLVSYSR